MVPLPRLITHAAKRRSGVVTQIEWRRSSWNFRNKSPLSSSASGQFLLTAASTANRLVIAPAVRRFLGHSLFLAHHDWRPGSLAWGARAYFPAKRLVATAIRRIPGGIYSATFSSRLSTASVIHVVFAVANECPASPGFAMHGRIIQFGSPCDFDVRHLHVRFSN